MLQPGYNVISFKILQEYYTDYDTKIYEAALIKKKQRPQPNKQL